MAFLPLRRTFAVDPDLLGAKLGLIVHHGSITAKAASSLQMDQT